MLATETCGLGGWYPPIGVFIGVLGVLGVIVPLVREHIGKREKAVWTIIMFALLLLEVRSIYLDRDEHDCQQREARQLQLTKFGEIAEKITGAVQKNDAHFNTTMASLSENLKTATGGNSFCYLNFTDRSDSSAIIVAIHEGKYPIRDVAARFVNQDNYRGPNPPSTKMTIEQILVGDASFQIGDLSQGVRYLSRYSLAGREHWNFLVEFSALNGFWHELIRLRKVDGTWVQAVRVLRSEVVGENKPVREVVVMEKIDKQFPRVNGKVDWGN